MTTRILFSGLLALLAVFGLWVLANLDKIDTGIDHEELPEDFDPEHEPWWMIVTDYPEPHF